MRFFSMILGTAAIASAAAAQDVQPVVEPSVAPMAIGFTADGLSGDGAEPIRNAMEKSQFVMLGEDHGYAGPPQLLSALAAEGADKGFDYYAIEVGPFSTRWAGDLLREGGSEALGEQLQGRPLALPFINLEEDADAATAFAVANRLWGVDQEFIGSPMLHLEWLRSLTDDEATLALVGQWLESERAAFATGDQMGVMMMKASADDWQALADAYADDALASERIEALSRSAGIYRHFLAGKGLDNNLDRIELIKETFLAHYHAAEAADGKPPRVLMKLGALHAGAGMSAMNTFDIGSLVPGIAASNKMRSLHIAYLPLAGSKTGINPSADGFFSVSEDENEELEAALVAGGVDVAAIGDGHYLIPLDPVVRNLGNKGLGELGQSMRFMLLGYDYLVTTRAAEAATPLAER